MNFKLFQVNDVNMKYTLNTIQKQLYCNTLKKLLYKSFFNVQLTVEYKKL